MILVIWGGGHNAVHGPICGLWGSFKPLGGQALLRLAGLVFLLRALCCSRLWKRFDGHLALTGRKQTDNPRKLTTHLLMVMPPTPASLLPRTHKCIISYIFIVLSHVHFKNGLSFSDSLFHLSDLSLVVSKININNQVHIFPNLPQGCTSDTYRARGSLFSKMNLVTAIS